MKKILALALPLLFIISCSTFEKDQLYGHWKNETWEFTFRENGTCKLVNNGVVQGEQLKYSTFGNTLEISRSGKVILSNLTIKGIENDQLKLEFRNLVGSGDKMEELEILTRQ